MSAPPPLPAPPNSPAPRPRFTLTDALLLLAGLGLIAWGGWLIWSRGGSPTGLMIAGFGGIMMPFAPLRLLGGIALGGICIWLIFKAQGPFDYAYAAIAGIVGLTTVKEAAASLRGQRDGERG